MKKINKDYVPEELMKYFRGSDYIIDKEAEKKYKDAETTIKDGMGHIHYGYYCDCMACPYVVYDEYGDSACYAKMFKSGCVDDD